MALYKTLRITNFKALEIYDCFRSIPRRINTLTTSIHFNNAGDNLETESSTLQKPSTKSLLENASHYDENYEVNLEDPWYSDEQKLINYKKRQKQSEYFISPKNQDLSEMSVILFPGQGTQFIGMGKELINYPNVKEMYDKASEILERDLFKLCCEGPAYDLNQTKYQQPAILLASLAAVEKLREENPQALESCIATAGFSIGEITALTFAGALNFENAVRLVKIRGEAMQIASDLNKSGMFVVFYKPDSKLKFACSVAKEFCIKNGLEDVDCRVASYLFPHCKVIAGNEEALQFIVQNKDDFKLKKLKRLDVSGAFHTDLMKPAAYVFSEALKNVHLSRPVIPVYSNVDGRPYKSEKHILKQLPKQIYQPVRWEQTLHVLYEKHPGSKFPMTYECGPGKSLTTILKSVNLKAWKYCQNVEA